MKVCASRRMIPPLLSTVPYGVQGTSSEIAAVRCRGSLQSVRRINGRIKDKTYQMFNFNVPRLVLIVLALKSNKPEKNRRLLL